MPRLSLATLSLLACMPVIILPLAGCPNWVLKIDPSLESNALVYEVRRTKSFLNWSFGPYRVEGDDKAVTKRTISSKRDIAWLNVLFGHDQPVAKIEKTVWSYGYKFIVGDEITWDAWCEHLSDVRTEKEKWVSTKELFRQHAEDDWTSKPGNQISTYTVGSQYTCRYTHADNEPWTFSIDGSVIKMTNKEVFFRAEGNPNKGYHWVQGDKHVAAVSRGTWTVWLDKRNSDAINDALAMATAGLLVVYR